MHQPTTIIHRNNIKITGEGTRPMLFAHGFGCDQHMWRLITPAFEKNYQVILFDYVGHGQSDVSSYETERYSTLRGYAQDILDVCQELRLRNVIFVGHSVSSMIGMLAAIQRPEIFSSIIMIGPSPCYINTGNYLGGFEHADIIGLLQTMEKNYTGWASFMAPNIMGHKERPELGKELEASFCATDPIIARQFAEVTFLSDNREDLSRLKVPSLILQCAEDMIAPAAVGDYLARELPESTLYRMRATGHCPHLSEPEETITLIKQYLDQTVR